MTNLSIIQQEVSSSIQTFAALKAKITEVAQQCKGLVIIDEHSLNTGKELAIKAKKITTAIEDHRKEITKPFFEAKQNIDKVAKELTEGLNEATKVLRNQILTYEVEKERQRKEELKRIEEERRIIEEEMRKARGDSLANLHSISKNGDIEIIMSPPEVNGITELKQQEIELAQQKSKDIRLYWTFALTDINQVPVDYLILNDKKVKDAIAAGVREIPGIKIFQEERLSIK
jgi:hypothetical protein